VKTTSTGSTDRLSRGALGALELVAVALHGGDLTASGLATALYLAFFASVLALGGYGTLAVRAD